MLFFFKPQKTTLDSTKKFAETDIINMLEFLIDNIFVMFGERIYPQTVGITYGYKLCSSSRQLVALLYEA